jgi:hypothetical protein
MKNFYLLAIIVATLFSCTKDLEDSLDTTESKLNETESKLNDTESELNDLKSTLEEAGISSNPVKVKHVYSLDDSGSYPMEDEFEFNLKEEGNSYIEDNGDNEYYIELEYYGDIHGNKGVTIEFLYNSSTKTITSKELELYYYNKYGRSIDLGYYDGSNDSNKSGDIVVNSIDLETGKINISAKIEYTKDSYNSEYDTDGEATFEFDGTLRLIERFPISGGDKIVMLH